jgi:hypothetical protein
MRKLYRKLCQRHSKCLINAVVSMGRRNTELKV